MIETNKDKIRDKVAEVIKLAESIYNIDLSCTTVSFNLTGRGISGYASFKRTDNKVHGHVRFNADMLQDPTGFKHIHDKTVPHELAHIVCGLKPELGGRKHNHIWKKVCLSLGGDGKRTASDSDIVSTVDFARGETYDYITTTGKTIRINSTRHRRMHEKGLIYRFKPTSGYGQIDKFCEHSLIQNGQVVKTWPAKDRISQYILPQAQLQNPPLNLEKGKTKADYVRTYIKEAKSKGMGQFYVVLLAMENLRMNKSMARRYVQENWSKA